MREYLLVFLVAAAATYLLSVFAREVAIRTGAVARVRDRDVHASPIPYFGGVAMLGGLVAAYVVAQQLPFLSRSQPFVFHDAGIVLIAGAMICAVGVVDDLFELDALTKLGGQVLAAGFLVLNGVQSPLPAARRRPVRPRPGPGRPAHRVHRGRDGERGELRRRARRARGRGGRDRRGRVLRLLLPARRRQQRVARLDRCPAQRHARRRLRRLPAAQLLPGPRSSWATPARC